MSTPARADRVRLCSPRVRTAAAAARERNTMDRKPMRAGIWVKLLRAEA